MADLTPDKQAILQRALENPDNPNSQTIITKARERGWIPSAEQETAQPGQSATAFGRGAAQGATFGFGDELSAGVEKGLGVAEKAVGGLAERAGKAISNVPLAGGLSQSLQSFGRGAQARGETTAGAPLSQLISENRIADLKAAQSNPVAFGAGKVAGGITTAAPIAAVAAPSIVGTVAVGTGLGAFQGLGESEKKNVEQALKDAGIGGAIGGLFGAAGASAGNIGKTFQRAGTSLARRATGMIKSVVNKVGGPEKADKAVALLLKKGAIKGNLRQIAENVETIRETSGAFIGEVFKKLDDAGISGVFNANRLKNSLVNSKMPGQQMTVGEFMNLPFNKALKGQFDDIVEAAADPQFADETFNSAQKFKSALKDKINFAKDPSERGIFGQAYIAVRDAIDDAVETAAPAIGDANLAKQFQDAKLAYGAARAVEKGIDSSLRSATGDRILSLTDWVALSGGGVSNAAIATAKKILESSRSLALGARAAQGTGNLLQRVGGPAGGLTTTLSGPAVGLANQVGEQ